MKQAITGAKIFSGNEFFDHKALLIDGEKIIDWKDDGKSLGPVLSSGKFAFRQMQWTRFRYRNLKIWELKS